MRKKYIPPPYEQLREGEWIEDHGRVRIIRSGFYASPRSLEEVIEHTFAHMSEDDGERLYGLLETVIPYPFSLSMLLLDYEPEELIPSHGTLMTSEEDERTCDMVDAYMQGDYDPIYP